MTDPDDLHPDGDSIHCIVCGVRLGTVAVEASEPIPPVRVADDGTRLIFTSWETGATVSITCPDCSDREADD